MSTKDYIPPKYIPDTDDDEEDDIDDPIYDIEDGKTQELENYLDNKDREEKKQQKQSIMQTTPFGTSVGSSWGNPTTPTGSSWGNTGGSSWGNTGNSGWGQQRTWGQPVNNNPWGISSGNTWNNSPSPWNNNQQSFGKKEELDRTKKIIFCDFLDCLVESYQSNGRPGLFPRGIYDIRLRFEVWDKIRCFGAERIYVITPKINMTTNNGADSWSILMNYVICSLSEYLRVPFHSCQILSQSHIGQSKEDLLKYILTTNKDLDKKDMLMVGLNSGLVGQSNLDFESARNCGIDYVDLGQLLSMYI